MADIEYQGSNERTREFERLRSLLVLRQITALLLARGSTTHLHSNCGPPAVTFLYSGLHVLPCRSRKRANA